MPSFRKARSTSICVAIPAWSVPGSQSVGEPRMRWNRVMISSNATNIAWPMCSLPVTFGGGIEMTKHCWSESPSAGLKYPDSSHHLYSRSSTSAGEYCFGISSKTEAGGSAHVLLCINGALARASSAVTNRQDRLLRSQRACSRCCAEGGQSADDLADSGDIGTGLAFLMVSRIGGDLCGVALFSGRRAPRAEGLNRASGLTSERSSASS
mmetsp:Transcript_8804/g.16290  ORF Transcript_8804/g.16290 Transcript_8804/m.16290 type:complete len:210 (-) Transcript_8804:235-864(-)